MQALVANAVGFLGGYFVWAPLIGAQGTSAKFIAAVALANSSPDIANAPTDPTTAAKSIVPLAVMWYVATLYPMTQWYSWAGVAYLLTVSLLGLPFNLPALHRFVW